MKKPARRSSKIDESYARRKPRPLFATPPAVSPPSSAASTPAPHQAQRLEQLIQLGIEAYQARRLDDAAGYLTHALEIAPDHPLANNCLGVVRRGQGQLPVAIACYQRALRANPHYAEAHNNLGVAYEAVGELSKAIECYQAALRAKPDYAAACNNLGNTLTKSGRPQEAVAHLQRALRLQPQLAAAHNNLGLAYSHLGQHADAERSFRQALQMQPSAPEGYLNLGNVLRAAGKREAARECYQQALQCQPGYVAAHVGMGNVLYDLGQPHEARAEYDRALLLQPDSAEAQFGIGNVHCLLNADEEALNAWRRALQLRPDYAEAHNNVGSLYHRQGHAVLAEKAFSEALLAKPDLLAAHNNLGNLYREQDRMDLASRHYGHILRRQPSNRPLAKLRLSTLCPAVWNSRDEAEEYSARALTEWSSMRGEHAYQDLPDLLQVANEPPYNLQFLHSDVRPLKEAYANIFRYTGPSFRPRPRTGKIHLGFVVTPSHEVAFLRLIWAALKRLNSDEFERAVICTRSSAFLLRAAIRPEEARIVELPDESHKVLHAIREQQFDLLHYFEICTDTLNYFLPFFRLAPVQVTSWGIQVTSGIPNVDGYLSSDLVEADDAQQHYSETLYRARTLLTYQTVIEQTEQAKTREDYGFSPRQHLYFCIQHLGKFHPDFDPLLGEILRRDPQGVVVGTQDKHGYGAQRLRERFARTMPDVADRIVFLPRQGFADYVRLAALSDVMLDPIHFGGVTTTYDGLSLNQPIVSLPSRFHRGRYTYGCYQRMGIQDCIASSAEEYVQIANRLATDQDWRQHVSQRIADARCRLFADTEAVSEHERLFRDLVLRSRQS